MEQVKRVEELLGELKSIVDEVEARDFTEEIMLKCVNNDIVVISDMMWDLLREKK